MTHSDQSSLATKIAHWRHTGAWICLANIVEWRATAHGDRIRRELHACSQVKAAIIRNGIKISDEGTLLISGEPATASDIGDIERSPQYRLPEGHDAMMYLLTQCWMRRDAVTDIARESIWEGIEQFLEEQIASAKRDEPSPPTQGRLLWDIQRILEEPGAAACIGIAAQEDYVRKRLNELGHKKQEGNLQRSIQRAKSKLRSKT